MRDRPSSAPGVRDLSADNRPHRLVGGRLDVRAGPHAGVAALESATLVFAKATPNTSILTAFKSPAQALVDHRAPAADSTHASRLNTAPQL